MYVSLHCLEGAQWQGGPELGSVGGGREAQAELASALGQDGLAGLSRRKSEVLTWAITCPRMAPSPLPLVPLGPPCRALYPSILWPRGLGPAVSSA